VVGTIDKKTIRLHGLCGKQELLILIDSGSSSSFISQDIVNNTGVKVQPIPTIQVSVANGEKLVSDKAVS
jgi:hypothetical protein